MFFVEWRLSLPLKKKGLLSVLILVPTYIYLQTEKQAVKKEVHGRASDGLRWSRVEFTFYRSTPRVIGYDSALFADGNVLNATQSYFISYTIPGQRSFNRNTERNHASNPKKNKKQNNQSYKPH